MANHAVSRPGHEATNTHRCARARTRRRQSSQTDHRIGLELLAAFFRVFCMFLTGRYPRITQEGIKSLLTQDIVKFHLFFSHFEPTCFDSENGRLRPHPVMCSIPSSRGNHFGRQVPIRTRATDLGNCVSPQPFSRALPVAGHNSAYTSETRPCTSPLPRAVSNNRWS